MICKKCGKENNNENKFCSNCGEQLIDDEKTIVLSKEEIKKEMEKIPVNETEIKEQKKKSNGLIIILLVLILFALIAIIGKQVIDYNSKLDNDINVGNNEDNKEQEIESDDEKIQVDLSSLNYKEKIGECIAIHEYSFNEEQVDNMLNIEIDNSLRRIIIKVNKEIKSSINENKTFVTNLDKKINKAFWGNFGLSPDSSVLFLLMEDGSLRYIDVYGNLDKTESYANINSLLIPELNNVIEIYQASVSYSGDGSSDSCKGITGWHTVVVKVKNGDLKEIDKTILPEIWKRD